MGQSSPLDALRVFAALAEAGSFTGAARQLGMPKQTVSRRIAALEETLGVRLVHRTTRQVALTEAGVGLAERSAEIVRLSREAIEAASSTSEVPTGTLRITAPEALGAAFLVPVLERFLADAPAVSVEVLLAERRVDLVAEGLDAALRVGFLDDSSLVATRLGPAAVRYVASPAYLARAGEPTADDLHEHDALVHGAEARLARWPLADGVGGLAFVAVRPRIAVNGVDAIRAACLAGLGIALLPAFLVTDDLRAGRLVSLLEPRLPDLGAVWLLTPSRRLLAARVRAFLDAARACAPIFDNPDAGDPARGGG